MNGWIGGAADRGGGTARPKFSKKLALEIESGRLLVFCGYQSGNGGRRRDEETIFESEQPPPEPEKHGATAAQRGFGLPTAASEQFDAAARLASDNEPQFLVVARRFVRQPSQYEWLGFVIATGKGKYIRVSDLFLAKGATKMLGFNGFCLFCFYTQSLTQKLALFLNIVQK